MPPAQAPRRRPAARGGAGIAFALFAAAALGACGAPTRPRAPPADRDPLAMLGGSGRAAPRLEDLLALYPLGGQPYRADLLATDDARSYFLVQSRRGVPPHLHRTHRERAWVLAGSGTCYVETRSYPAVPGSAFKIEPGLVHRVSAEGGDAVLVALVVFEPPMATIDEDRVKVE